MIDKYNLAVWRSGPRLSEALLETSKQERCGRERRDLPFEESVCFSTSRTLLRAEILGKQRLRAGTWIEAFIAPRGEQAR
jgi:hypothetical protein